MTVGQTYQYGHTSILVQCVAIDELDHVWFRLGNFEFDLDRYLAELYLTEVTTNG